MLPRRSLNRPIIVMEQIENEVQGLLDYMSMIRGSLNPIQVSSLIELQRRLINSRAYLASTVGLTGLQAFMRSSLGGLDSAYDYSAAVSALTTPGQSLISWIKTNTGGTTTQFDASDNPSAKSIDATALGPLIDALVTAITT